MPFASAGAATAAAGSPPAMQTAATIMLQGGLMVVHRALLCRCNANGVSDPAATATGAAAAGAEGDRVDPAAGGGDALAVAMAHWRAAHTDESAGRLQLLSDAEVAHCLAAAAESVATHSAALPPGHSPQCRLVLVKTSANERTMHLTAVKLKFEFALIDKLSQSRSAAETSAAAATDVHPHLRQLSDGRLALVLPDHGGLPLLQAISAHSSYVSSAFPSASVSPPSSASASSTPTAMSTPFPPAVPTSSSARHSPSLHALNSAVATSVVAGTAVSGTWEQDVSPPPHVPSESTPPPPQPQPFGTPSHARLSAPSSAAVAASTPSGTVSGSSSGGGGGLVPRTPLLRGSVAGGSGAGGQFSTLSSSPTFTIAGVARALRATLAIASELQRIHSCGLVLKSLEPASVLLHASRGRVQFLDLSAASLLVKERAEPDAPLLGPCTTASAWLYASPEQSGKANRSIDSRSDLYALGCVAVELLTGRPPFLSADPLELIHLHLAKAPPTLLPRHITPENHPLLHPLLRATQSIVHKLLQKQAEDRYQSASGLMHDLRAVIEALAAAGHAYGPPLATVGGEVAMAGPVSATAAAAAPASATPAATASVLASVTPPAGMESTPSPPSAAAAAASTGGSRIGVSPACGTPAAAAALSSCAGASPAPSVASTSTPSSTVGSSPAGVRLVPGAGAAAGLAALRDFQAGLVDHVSTFRLSQKLYGRESAVEQLRKAYAQVCADRSRSLLQQSSALHAATTTAAATATVAVPVAAPSAQPVSAQLFLISGYSGVGKTSLVDELHQHILAQRGLFARGKFEMFRRDSSCLIGAFRQLIVALMVRDAVTWKVRILRALGANGSVLLEVLPELARLIGDQPPVPKLSTGETANRFNMCFLQFVSCLASAASPLVLFVDDLQLADTSSLALLRLLLEHESAHLLIIGAYRDNEVDGTHPLAHLIDETRQAAPERVTQVSLQALSTPHISQLLVDSFRCSSEAAAPLAALLATRTQGNPFYLSQLLKSFHDTGLMRFDFATATWAWDLRSMRLTSVQGDVVDLVLRHMQSLSEDAQQLLQYASCQGAKFSLHSLHIITKMSIAKVSRSAVELEHAGLLLCTKHPHDLFLLAEAFAASEVGTASAGAAAAAAAAAAATGDPAVATPAAAGLGLVVLPDWALQTTRASSEPSPSSAARLASIQLQFAHDRVQAAAYRLIPAEKVSAVHCVIAAQLLDKYDEAELEEYAIDICGHINTGWIDAIEAEGRATREHVGGTEAASAKSPDQHLHASTGADAAAPAAADIAPASSSSSAAAVTSSSPPLPSPPACRSAWLEFWSRPGRVDRVIALELTAGKQAKAASACGSALHLFFAALRLVQQDSCGFESLLTVSSAAAPSSASAQTQSTSAPGADADAAPPSTVSPGPDAASSLFLRVDDLAWEKHYASCLSLYAEVAACLFLTSQFPAAQQCIEYALSHVSCIEERASFFELRVQNLIQLQQLSEAEEVGLAHLRELGVELLPAMNDELSRWCFAVPTLEDESTFTSHPVFSLEEMTDPLDVYAMLTLSALAPAMFVRSSPNFHNLVLTMLWHTQTKGTSPDAALAFACLGVCLWPSNQLSASFCMGRIAHLVLESFGEVGRSAAPRTHTVVVGFCYPWSRHTLRDCLRMEEVAGDEALQLGDTLWSSYLLLHQGYLVFTAGLGLPLALQKQRALLALCKKKRLALPMHGVETWMEMTAALAGTELPPRDRGADSTVPLLDFSAHLTDGILAYYRRRLGEALLALERAAPLLAAMSGMAMCGHQVFFHCLALLGSCPKLAVPALALAPAPLAASTSTSASTSPSAAPTSPAVAALDPHHPDAGRPSIMPPDYDASLLHRRLREADALIAQLSIWASHAPQTYAHKLHLAQAERARVGTFSHLRLDQTMLAMQLYEAAADGARAGGFGMEEGLALELGARFFLDCRRLSTARALLLQCCACYAAVGAQAKLAQLYAEFPSIADMGGSLGGGMGMGVGVGVGVSVSVSGGSGAIAVARSLSGAGLEMLSPLGNVSASSFSPLAAERSISAATLASRGGLSATASASASAGDLLLLPTGGGGGGGGASSARLDSVPSSGMSSSSLAHSSAPSSCPASAAHTNASSSGFSSPHHAGHPVSQMPTTAVTPQQHSFDGSGGGGGGSGMSNSSSTLGSSDALSVLKATSSFATEKDTTKLLQRLMRCVLECAGATRGVLVLRDAQGDWSVELGGSVEADTELHDHGAMLGAGADDLHDHGATPCSQLQHELEGAATDRDDVKRDDIASVSVSVSAGIQVSVDGSGGAAVAVSMQPCAPLLPSECLTRTPSPVKLGVAASSPPSADAVSSVPAPLRVSSEGGAVVSSPPGALFSPLTDRSPMLPPPSLPAVLQPLESQLSCSSSSASQLSHSHGSTLSSGSHVRVGSQSGVVSVESALPMSCFQYVLSSVETLLLSDPARSHDASASAFASDPYFATRHPRALLCMPVLRGGEVFGVLYLENDYRSAAFTSSHIQLLQLLCGQAALSIDNARLYSQLSANNASLELRNAQLLAAKEAAEAATKVKADFLSNMSHEIRTPMNAVLGIGRLLADTPLSLEQQQYVAMMNNSGHLLLTIINDILDYSKIEAGQLKLNYSRQNVCDVVEAAAMLCYDMAVSKGLALSWFVDPALPPALMLDATRLQQILLNLLSNAIKFTKVGGVELTVRRHEFAQQSSTPIVGSPKKERLPLHIIVQDSGIGISSQQLSTLFKSFSQVQHISGEYGGTGLGLVISKRLVEAMGGSIEVHSELGKGSRFETIVLCDIPMAPPVPSPTQRQLSAATPAAATTGTGSPPRPAAAASASSDGSTTTVSPPNSPDRSSLKSSSGPLGSPTAAVVHVETNIHGLTVVERQQLSGARLLYVGELHAAARGWVKLVEHYVSSVHVCASVEEARRFLRPPRAPLLLPRVPGFEDSSSSSDSNPRSGTPTAPMRARLPRSTSSLACTSSNSSNSSNNHGSSGGVTINLAAVESATGGSSSGSSPEDRSIDLILVDLDSKSCTEEAILEQLCDPRGPPRRLLALYSRAFQALPVDAAAAGPASTPSVTPPSISTQASPCLAPRALGLSPRGGLTPPNVPVHPSAGGASASPAPFPLRTISRPPPRAGGVGSAAARASDAAAAAAAASASQSLALARSIRKPWTARALIRAVLTLLNENARIQSDGSASPMSGVDSAGRFPSDSDPLAGPLPTAGLPLRSLPADPASSDSSLAVLRSRVPAPHGAKSKIKTMSAAYPLRILLAEDNLINQKMMVMLLRKLGYEILVAAHGREALEILAREADKGREVECILMDASMDVMDGIECTRVIRAQQLPHRVRPFIIAQTANVTEEYRRACLDAGMDLFTVKPVHVEELVACLKKAHAHAQLALMAQHAGGGGGGTAAAAAVTSGTAGGGSATGTATPLTSPPVDPTETPPGGASTTVAGTATTGGSTSGAATSTPAAPSSLSPPSPLLPAARLALTPGL